MLSQTSQTRILPKWPADLLYSLDFNLPFETGDVVSRNSIKTLGHGAPQTDVITDPFAWPTAALLIEEHKRHGNNSNPYKWSQTLKELMEEGKDKISTTQSDRKSTIYRLPVEPGLAKED